MGWVFGVIGALGIVAVAVIAVWIYVSVKATSRDT